MYFFFFSSRRRHTRCALVTGVQTCALPIFPCAISVDDADGRVRIVVKSSGIASEEGAISEYEYFESSPQDRAAGYVGEVMSDPGDIEEAYQETEAAALETSDPTYRPVFMSTNAITLSDKIQIVLRFYGEADAIHENYDFVHCTNYWTSKDANLTLRQPALESLLCKELRYVGSKRSEEHTSELQSLMRISYAVFCLKKKKKTSH